MNERGTGRRKAAGKGRRSERLGHIGEALRGMAVPIVTLTGDEHNARRHSRRNLDAIRASLERFGQQVPLVFTVRDRKKVVVKGNGLLIAARQLGWRYLAAVRSTLTARELRAYAIADNRTSDLSDFDAELLAAQLQELEETDFDIEAAGFTDAELQDLVESLDEPPGAATRQAQSGERKRGERTAQFVIGHLKFQVPRAEFDRWMTSLEAKVGGDPDRLAAEVKRRLKI